MTSQVSQKGKRAVRGPVLVLGARSDIARALAHAFAARGANLQLAARDPAKLASDCADIEIRHQVKVSVHRYDALEFHEIEAFLDDLPNLPRVVISVVGLMGNQDENARDPDKTRRIVDTNFTGPAVALEAVARRMATLEEDTTVIAISSVAGDRGRARNYVYGAAKAGLSAYVSGLRQKYFGSRVHIMTVKPGFVETAMTEGMDLPKPLLSSPEQLARGVMRAFDRKADVYLDTRWRAVMGVIKLIPEPVFKRLKF